METTEEFLTDETEPTGDFWKEAWPVSPDEMAKEFEEYLMEIGLRL